MEHRPDPHLVALLAWYRDMGVTEALAEGPLNRLSHGDKRTGAPGVAETDAPDREQSRPAGDPRSTPPAPRPKAARAFTMPPPAAAEVAARTAAVSARSLDELRVHIDRFEGCALSATAKNLCFYRGAPRARLMIIGEAPGREEDLEGKPFVGRAGQLLDRMLAAIGLGEEDVHITNIVYWRPPGNRTPTPQEALVCRPFLMRQIELVAPEVLLLLGGAAAKQILDVSEGILRIRGKWRPVEIAGRTIPAMATLHPAYLLRTPASKRLAWRDLLTVREKLDSLAAEAGVAARE